MPSATLTVREVKNKSTGIDIAIPSYKEIPGMLGSTVEFNVVVVSRLAYFKSPKHKDNDVVQFMIPRKYPDFEQLHLKLSEQFAGTILPPLPKKVLRLTEAVIKDRKLKLENLLKFLACTPKLSTSSTLLQFLGVNAIKAGKYRKGEVDETERKTDTESKASDVGKENVDSADPPDTDLFGEAETVDDSDLFGAEEESDIFQSENTELGGPEAKLFEDQDFGGGLEEGQAAGLLVLPEARVTEKTRDLMTGNAEHEDNSDLLKVEDDLDQFLVLDIRKSREDDNNSDKNMKETSGYGSKKPELKPKPALSKKPDISQKPNVGNKPKIPSSKPALPRKPSGGAPTKTKAVSKGEETVPKKDNSSDPSPQESSADLGNDDILKYIQENAAAEEDDVDLFS